ncbi:MAG: peptidase M14 [Myxococcales bacterium]|nr:peptidase M14 [Myxococcales bacterium]
MTAAQLASLSLGFRNRYLSYDELTTQLSAWASAFPEHARLESIGKTPEGRDLWVLTVGDDRRGQPAVWVDGNMHATEVAGSSVALAIAEDALALRLGQAPSAALPPATLKALRDVVFHVMPRMSPDGAETVLSTGRYVRSVPRDARPHRQKARWSAGDVDGDGLALLMRVADETGEYVEDQEVPGLLIPRGLEDEGPFYRLFPEGHIENFDGHHVPEPHFLSDNDPDLNRNFPASWAPEPEQVGAGRFATSEPESRAVVDYVVARPNLFAWFNLHTYGGCFIRPPGDHADNKMDQEDLAIYREVGDYSERLTGYPMVSGFEEFTYAPDTPLRGDLCDFAYLHRGCIAYVCELWDLFHQLGMERPKRFVDFYRSVSREALHKLVALDRGKNEGRIFRPWKKVTHPQLGAVEVGGLDPRIGISNPPLSMLADVCRAQTAAWLRTASLVPRVVVSKVATFDLESGLTEVEVVIENHGYLATYGLPSAKRLPWNEPLWATIAPGDGVTLLEPAAARRQEVGHLEGWGRGKDSGASSTWFARSRGTASRRVVRFVVRGAGTVDVTVESCRVGRTSVRVDVRAEQK